MSGAGLPGGARPPGRLRAAARLGAAALLLALLGPAAVPAQDGAGRRQNDELKRTRDQIEQLGRERTQAEAQLARLQSSQKELKLEIETLSELVRESKRRKEALELRIRRQQRAEAAKEAEAKRLERAVRDGQRRIALRLRRLFRLAKQGRQAMLFQMARYRSFPKDSRYVAMLQESDRTAIANFEELNRQAEEARAVLKQSVERLLTLREELDEETRNLAEREEYVQSAMADVTRNRTLYKQYLRDMEQMMGRMESAVTRLESESRKATPLPGTAPSPKPAKLRGALPPPAQGRIIARFGEQDPRYDLKKRQRGIVLRVDPGTKVAAVAAGRALHAGPFRGYQSLVVLDHGNGLFTVYGHLEDLTVKRGQWVEQGTVLGKATYQPVEEAYDVYFEVRYHGKPDDPLHWLQAGRLQNGTVPAAGG